MELTGKKILITGAANRLGRSMALTLASEGAKLILHYNSSEKNIRECKELIVNETSVSKENIQTVSGDFTKPDAADTLFKKASAFFGGIDIVINNASLYPVNSDGTEKEGEEAGIEKVNAQTPLRLATLLSDFITSRNLPAPPAYGCVINMLDTRIADTPRESESHYLRSKRILAGETKKQAKEFAPGIRINAIAPGLILPPPSHPANSPGEIKEFMDKRRQFNPLHISPSVDNITDALLFLLKSDGVTGQIIFVDGGRHLKELSDEL